MAGYITHLNVHQHGADEKKLQSQGLKKIDVNLNRSAGGKPSYLWYKKGNEELPVTRIQLAFNVQMSVGLAKAGYTKNPFPIIPVEGADPIYIWVFIGSPGEYDTPIVDLNFTSDAADETLMFHQGWERLGCDLNRNGGGDWIYMWVKREKQTYICDVAVTDSFKSDEQYFRDGYIRVDEDAHRGAGRAFVFVWYRQTTDPKRAIRDLKVSTTDEEFQELQEQGYQPVSFDFNGWTGSSPMYLWYTKEGRNKPIKDVNLLLNVEAVPVYERAGVTVVKKKLNTGDKGRVEYLSFYQ